MTVATRSAATGAPSYTETWPCQPESARRARLLVAAALHTWGMGELQDAAELVVAELVNNTIQHRRCRMIRVRISRGGCGTVRISVADKGRDIPVRSNPNSSSENGRGLRLIDAVSLRWGCDRKRWGKVVWADLKVPVTC